MSEGKSAKAYRTISEVAESLGVPQHVLRFWETKFPAVKPLKRGGNRRYYRPEDIEILQVIHRLLHVEGYTIKGAQKLLKEQGARPLVETLLGSEAGAQPVPLALAAAAPETDDAAEDEADNESAGMAAAESASMVPPAAAAGETLAVDAMVLSAQLAGADAPVVTKPVNDGGAVAAPEDMAAAASIMPVEAEPERSIATMAPERAASPAGGEPAARQPRGALVDELRAIRARLAEALAAAAPAAR